MKLCVQVPVAVVVDAVPQEEDLTVLVVVASVSTVTDGNYYNVKGAGDNSAPKGMKMRIKKPKNSDVKYRWKQKKEVGGR